MAKQIAPLPRLRQEDDIVQWARQLVDQLQAIFLGTVSVIDGQAIIDQSIPSDKMKP